MTWPTRRGPRRSRRTSPAIRSGENQVTGKNYPRLVAFLSKTSVETLLQHLRKTRSIHPSQIGILGGQEYEYLVDHVTVLVRIARIHKVKGVSLFETRLQDLKCVENRCRNTFPITLASATSSIIQNGVFRGRSSSRRSLIRYLPSGPCRRPETRPTPLPLVDADTEPVRYDAARRNRGSGGGPLSRAVAPEATSGVGEVRGRSTRRGRPGTTRSRPGAVPGRRKRCAGRRRSSRVRSRTWRSSWIRG
jgi:hypothetical protein